MENKSKIDNQSHNQLFIIIILTLITSILPEVICREVFGAPPSILPFVKISILFLGGILSHYLKLDKINKYILVLGFLI